MKPLFPILGIALSGLSAAFSLSAQTMVEVPRNEVQEELVHQDGDVQVILQRIAPPAPKPVLPPPAPTPIAQEPEGPRKTHHLLHFSATVYDGAISVVEWSVQQRKYRAYVNVDFNDLAGTGSFETSDAAYSLLFAVGNETNEALASMNAAQLEAGQPADSLVQLPALSSFPENLSSYFLAGSPDPALVDVDADCAGLEALLDYYDAHKLEFKLARQRREAESKAREQWLKDHPPVPQNVLIQIWPIKSGIYPTRQGGTAR